MHPCLADRSGTCHHSICPRALASAVGPSHSTTPFLLPGTPDAHSVTPQTFIEHLPCAYGATSGLSSSSNKPRIAASTHKKLADVRIRCSLCGDGCGRGKYRRQRGGFGQVHLEGDAWGDFQEERTLRWSLQRRVAACRQGVRFLQKERACQLKQNPRATLSIRTFFNDERVLYLLHPKR